MKKKTQSTKRKPKSPKKKKKNYKPILTILIAAISIIGIYRCYLGKTSEYNVKLPDGYEIHGLDISHHQGNINWQQLSESQKNSNPIRFIFIKATEGGDFLDTKFHSNFADAKQNGFICGAYHFYNPKTSPDRQAAFFIKQVTLSQGDLPPVLDIEERGEKPLSTFQNELITWLKKIEKHYNTKPIIYASYSFKNNYLNDSIFNTYPFWIAHYYTEKVEYKNKWHFWQHSDKAFIQGIGNNVDLNVFNGTENDFQNLIIKKTASIY